MLEIEIGVAFCSGGRYAVPPHPPTSRKSFSLQIRHAESSSLTAVEKKDSGSMITGKTNRVNDE